MKLFKSSRSVLLHRVKTALYALSVLVLVGWVTDALNEGLMFKLVLRYLYPQLVESYQHPYESLTSFFIWGIPLLISLIIMLIASILTVHHFKKRHVYKLEKSISDSQSRIVIASPQSLEEFDKMLIIHKETTILHLILYDDNEILNTLINNPPLENTQPTVIYHRIEKLSGLSQAVYELLKIIKAAHTKHPKDELAFDLNYSSSLLSAAAMYCALEQDIILIHQYKNITHKYDLIYEMSQ